MAARASHSWAPRVVRAAGAAYHAAYDSEKAFLKAVAEGDMPPPFTLNGGDAWDVEDINAAIDALKAGTRRARPWQEKAPARV